MAIRRVLLAAMRDVMRAVVGALEPVPRQHIDDSRMMAARVGLAVLPCAAVEISENNRGTLSQQTVVGLQRREYVRGKPWPPRPDSKNGEVAAIALDPRSHDCPSAALRSVHSSQSKCRVQTSERDAFSRVHGTRKKSCGVTPSWSPFLNEHQVGRRGRQLRDALVQRSVPTIPGDQPHVDDRLTNRFEQSVGLRSADGSPVVGALCLISTPAHVVAAVSGWCRSAITAGGLRIDKVDQDLAKLPMRSTRPESVSRPFHNQLLNEVAHPGSAKCRLRV